MSAPTPKGVPRREFARLAGCDEKQVRRAIENGRLKPFSDGTLDPSLVAGDWRRRKRLAADTADKRGADNNKMSAHANVRADETAADAAERIISIFGAENNLNEAIRIKENYNALLKQLEYDIKSSAVVMVADVVQAVSDEYAKVRTRLLAIPAEQAPRLHRLKTVAEVQDALQEIITEALEELTRDGASGA